MLPCVKKCRLYFPVRRLTMRRFVLKKEAKRMQSLHCAHAGGFSLAARPLLCVATGEYNEKGWFT